MELTRKRDAEATKARILEAAKEAFSDTSYNDAGIREIGLLAGTSSTLLLRYFGSKAGLFEAALIDAIPIPEMMRRPRAEFGTYMAKAMLQPGKKLFSSMMIARATGNSEAGAIAARVVESRGIAPLAEWLGAPDGRRRALQIAMLANGVVTYMKQLPFKSPTAAERQQIESWFAKSVQAVVDEDIVGS